MRSQLMEVGGTLRIAHAVRSKLYEFAEDGHGHIHRMALALSQGCCGKIADVAQSVHSVLS